MVCYDKNEEWTSPLGDNFQSGLVDSTIVCDQMMLAAWNIGIGSCWVGYFNHNEVEKAFNLPENIKSPFSLYKFEYVRGGVGFPLMRYPRYKFEEKDKPKFEYLL